MRVRGRRHWGDLITIQRAQHVTSGPNTGEVTTTTLAADVPATVQPVSDAEAIRNGLETGLGYYWGRWADPPVRTGDRVLWNGATYRVINPSVMPGSDVQALLERQ